jgi:hypothetical protein
MKSSSFGNLIGKERDEIPGYGIKNYAETEPDLTDAVNKQIEANQQDTIQFYNEMAEIQKLIAETPMKNLESLATFSSRAGQAMEVFKDRQEARELRQESDDFLEKNSGAELYNKEGTFELESAKFDNELLNENTEASLNFLRARNIEVPQDLGIKQLLRNLNTNYFGARSQFLNENGAQEMPDSDEFINLHDAADELMVTAMLRKARELGIDTNSREFKKAFYNTIYPDIKQRRENNLQSWKGNANRNFNKINKKKTRDIIVKTLEPYSENAKMDIDVMTLVETVKNRIPEVKTNRDAIEYIFSEVATESGEDGRRLNVEHLEYLFDGAIFEHTATGKKSTIADGDFNFKDTLNSIMQNAEIQRANEVQQSNRADEVLAKDEYDAFIKANPNVSPGVEANFLQDLETKYPSFDASTLNSGSGNTGGEYDGQANKPDATIDYKQILQDGFVATKDKATPTELRQIEKAYGDFKAKVANLVAAGVDPREAEGQVFDTVSKNLSAGRYSKSSIEARIGRQIQPVDILADNELLRSDSNKVRFNSDFNSLAEQIALSQYKRHKLYGEAFPTYFKGVTRGTKISAIDFAEDRFRSMNGYNGLGEIAERFTPNKNGVLVDKQFGLSKKQLNEFEVKPHLTKTNIKLLQDPKLAEKVLIGFRKDGNELGTYSPATGFGKRNGDQLTVGQVIEYANRGSSNWGVYGFSAQEIKEATKSGVISKDTIFDEETQSQMVFELLRQRSNRTNSIRGAIIQAKKGGEETIFEGDEEIGRWDRLVEMDSNEIQATLNVFPMLREMPMNQFQNLTAGVVLNIEQIVKEEEAKETGDQKIARIDRNLAYYNDLLGKVTEGDKGFLGTRILTKAASRFILPRPKIEQIIKDLEAQKAEIEKLRTND